MLARVNRDIWGGAALLCAGAFVTYHAVTTLSLGTISQMGPGMFPAGLGILLAGLGALTIIAGLAGAGAARGPAFDVRSFLTLFASMLAFAVLVRPFGFVPAVVALTLIVSRADSRLSIVWTLVLAGALALTAFVIFRLLLGMPVAAFAWPW